MKSSLVHSPVVKVALFPESSHGVQGWIAKAIDAPLVAQGDTLEAAKDAFRRVFRTHLILCSERDEVPFLGIKVAGWPKRSTRAPLPAMAPDRIEFSTLQPA